MKNEKREEVTLMKREKTEVQLKTKKGNLIKKEDVTLMKNMKKSI